MKKAVFVLSMLVLGTWATNQAVAQNLISTGILQHQIEPEYTNVNPGFVFLDKVKVDLRVTDISAPYIPVQRWCEVRIYYNESTTCPSSPSRGVLIGKGSFMPRFRRTENHTLTIDVDNYLVSCPTSACPVVPFNISAEVVALTPINPPGYRHRVVGQTQVCKQLVAASTTEGITSPTEGADIFTGGTFDLRWNPSFFNNVSTVQLQVFSNGTLRFSGNVPNNGQYSNYQGPDGSMQVIVTGGGQTDTVNFEFTQD
ncbi:hypothetical protein BKI52_15515 [marine bacterium AO1-C]|nr:hypothetical protein BKI52_15515 [marine bacterium AO1-C]